MCIVVWQMQTLGFEITGYMKSVSYFIYLFIFLHIPFPSCYLGFSWMEKAAYWVGKMNGLVHHHFRLIIN